MGFYARIDIGVGSDCARNSAGGDFLACLDKPFARTHKLAIEPCKFQPERRRLGMNAMASPNRRREFVFHRAALQSGKKRIEVLDQKIGSAGKLYCKAGIKNVRRGHTLMNKTRVLADDLGKMG